MKLVRTELYSRWLH